MVQTRSMSKKTNNTRSMSKKTNNKIAVNHKVVKRESKQTRKKAKVSVDEDSYERIYTIDDEACSIFMIDDYLIRHPPNPEDKCLPLEVDRAGQLEWGQMSALEKAPFIEKVRERWRVKPAYERHGFPDY